MVFGFVDFLVISFLICFEVSNLIICIPGWLVTMLLTLANLLFQGIHRYSLIVFSNYLKYYQCLFLIYLLVLDYILSLKIVLRKNFFQKIKKFVNKQASVLTGQCFITYETYEIIILLLLVIHSKNFKNFYRRFQ